MNLTVLKFFGSKNIWANSPRVSPIHAKGEDNGVYPYIIYKNRGKGTFGKSTHPTKLYQKVI